MPFTFNAVELYVVTINEKPRYSQKFDIYNNEKGMYELSFSSQQKLQFRKRI